DGAVALPKRQLLRRAIFIDAVVLRPDVAVPTVGICFHQRWPGAISNCRHLISECTVDLDYIVAKNAPGAYPEGGDTLANVFRGLALQLVRVGGVPVVLADEEHWQPPHARVIHRLPESAFVGGALAESGNCDLTAILQLEAAGG